jgi:type II secretion system protein G
MKKHGFTLVELLITVSIIAILIAIGIASYTTINRQSRDTKRRSDMEQIRSALEMYRADNGWYPAAGSGSWTLATNLESDLVTAYILAIPADPKSTQYYMYRATTSNNGHYYGYCLGGTLESEDPTDSCTPDTGQNFGIKNP